MKTMNYIVATAILVTISGVVFSQNTSQGVSIANDQVPPSPNAMLDVVSSNKGILIPRVSYATIDVGGVLAEGNVSLNPDEDGLMVYVTDADENHGFWYFDANSNGGEWLQLLNTATGSTSSLWVENTTHAGNIYYPQGTVMINGDPAPTDPMDQEDINAFPLLVHTYYGSGLVSDPIKIGGAGTYYPADSSIYTGHSNEINYDESSLDLQFWNGQPVRIGSSINSADLEVFGTVFCNGFVNYSDSTLKTAIRSLKDNYTIDDLKAKIKNVKLYSYELKSNPGEKHYGVIAQELEQIFPDVVKTYDRATEKTADGTIKTTPTRAVDYSALSIFSLEMVKELISENENQQDRIDTLEQQVQDLIQRVEALENK